MILPDNKSMLDFVHRSHTNRTDYSACRNYRKKMVVGANDSLSYPHGPLYFLPGIAIDLVMKRWIGGLCIGLCIRDPWFDSSLGHQFFMNSDQNIS